MNVFEESRKRDLLDRCGLSVHDDFDGSLLICIECASILSRNNFRSHLRLSHSISIDKDENSFLEQVTDTSRRAMLLQQLLRISGSNTVSAFEVSFNNTPIKAIDCLPVVDGYSCSLCHLGETNLRMYHKRHLKH